MLIAQEAYLNLMHSRKLRVGAGIYSAALEVFARAGRHELAKVRACIFLCSFS